MGCRQLTGVDQKLYRTGHVTSPDHGECRKRELLHRPVPLHGHTDPLSRLPGRAAGLTTALSSETEPGYGQDQHANECDRR